jgi:hypothetical protein
MIAELDAADIAATDLVAGLTVEQLNWHPAPGAWSVGQCLEHLCITNELYLPAIAAALVGRSAGVAQEVTPGWFTRWFIRSFIEPSPQTKHARAPKKIVPGARVEASVIDRFLAGNQGARELVRRASGFDVNRIRFKNPFLPGLRFTVGAGLQIVCRHEKRHLLQGEKAAIGIR